VCERCKKCAIADVGFQGLWSKSESELAALNGEFYGYYQAVATVGLCPALPCAWPDGWQLDAAWGSVPPWAVCIACEQHKLIRLFKPNFLQLRRELS
jgi:hypothetical protein